MGLPEIAAGLEVTAEQDERGVTTVDATEASLAERLNPFADSLPCSPSEAATVLERYVGGGSVGAAGRAAGLPPTTAAKTLHLLGESVSPVSPEQRAVIDDWLTGHLSRTEALELTRLGEREFALAVYVRTHEPLEDAAAAVEGILLADDGISGPL